MTKASQNKIDTKSLVRYNGLEVFTRPPDFINSMHDRLVKAPIKIAGVRIDILRCYSQHCAFI